MDDYVIIDVAELAHDICQNIEYGSNIEIVKVILTRWMKSEGVQVADGRIALKNNREIMSEDKFIMAVIGKVLGHKFLDISELEPYLNSFVEHKIKGYKNAYYYGFTNMVFVVFSMLLIFSLCGGLYDVSFNHRLSGLYVFGAIVSSIISHVCYKKYKEIEKRVLI